MRLERIEIKNFRQYRNREFTFQSKYGKPDVHIIVANNGVGKTNMLNAIKWCLYEIEPHLSNASAAEPRLNKAAADASRAEGKNFCSLSVTLELSQGDRIYRITRTEDYKLTAKDEIPFGSTTLQVMQLVGTDWESVTSEDAAKGTILRLVPQLIQDYVFFDGEQLSSYFRADQQKKVCAGVKGLTKVDMLEDIIKQIIRYQKQNITSKLTTSGDEQLATATLFFDRKKQIYDNICSAIEEKKTDLGNYASQIEVLSNTIKGFESVKSKQEELENIENRITKVKAAIDENQKQKMVFARKYYRLFGIWPAIKSYFIYLRDLDQKGELPPKFDKVILEAMKQSGHCLVCDRDLDEHGKNHIDALIHQLTVSTTTSSYLNQTLPILRQAMENMMGYETELKQINDKRDSLKKELLSLEEKLQDLKKFLNEIPNAEDIRQNIIDRDELKSFHSRALVDLGRLEEEKRTAKVQMDNAEAKKQQLQAKNAKLSALNAQDAFCTNSVNALTEVCEEILADSRSSLAALTMKFFKQFLWKQDTFAGVEIKENFEFFLYNDRKQQILGSCSAAEISLLALSFTLALQQDTKNDSLLYIDTPVGRVDEENRTNFMKVLMDIAQSKQVILTFTPSEYDANIRRVVANDYSSYSVMSIENGINVLK